MESLSFINTGKYKIVDTPLSIDKSVKEFVHFNGNKYLDINIIDMKFSVRSYNCLANAGYNWFSEIICLNQNELKDIPNMGSKSINEIINTLESLTLQVLQLNHCKKSNSDILCNLIFQRLSEFMILNGSEHYNNVISICDRYTEEHPDINDFEFVLSNTELLKKIYSNNYIKQEYQIYLVDIIKKYKYGCTYNNILEKTPTILCNKAFIDKNIIFLIEERKIKIIDDSIYVIILDSFIDGLKNILKEREYDVFIKRTQNLTLEQIGIEIGITRERVRQIESKAIVKIIKSQIIFKEDIYVDIFKEYEITYKEFVIAFKNVQTYYYLAVRYSITKEGENKNKKLLSEALYDARIPEKMKRAIEKAVYKNYIKLGSEYIPCTRPDITNYVLKTFATNDIKFDNFKELYITIIEDIGKKYDEKLSLMDRGYENRLAASDTVLWKLGKKLRYYNMQSYDFENLFDVLNLEQYSNVEYSTRKFFNLYPETMKDYDIRDEYELHNLLKKLCKDREINNINFSRMPNIEIGQSDRDEQVLNLLLMLAPISNTEFAQAYEDEYGVSSATVLANYMKEFDEYFHDGKYKIDSPMLPKEVSSKLKDLLNNDFYLIDTIKKIYTSEFPDMDISLLNPFSIKAIGFRVYSTYAVSDKFSTATDFLIVCYYKKI